MKKNALVRYLVRATEPGGNNCSGTTHLLNGTLPMDGGARLAGPSGVIEDYLSGAMEGMAEDLPLDLVTINAAEGSVVSFFHTLAYEYGNVMGTADFDTQRELMLRALFQLRREL